MLIDLLLITGYFIIVLWIGVRSGRNETSEGFLLADRDLGPWESAATICASKTGAGILLTYLSFIYLYGISATWFFLSSVVGYGLFYFFARRLKREADARKYYTLSDYFFARGNSIGYLSAVTLLLSSLLTLSVQFIAGAKILSDIAGIAYLWALALIAGAIMVYIVIGGFKAVVHTDIFQYVAIIALTIMMAFIVGTNTHVLPASWDLFSMSPGLIIGLIVAGVLWPFSSAELWQRVYATRNAKDAQRSLLYASTMYIGYGLLLSAIGLAIKSSITLADPDLALLEGFRQLLPPQLLGLGVVLLYAAIMSSADTLLFTSSSITVQDLIDRIRRKKGRHLVNDVRTAAILIGTLSFFIALGIQSLVDVTYLYASLLFPLAALVIMTWVRKVNALTLFSGLLSSTLVVLISAVFIQDERLVFFGLAGLIAGIAISWCYGWMHALHSNL